MKNEKNTLISCFYLYWKWC